VRGWTKKGPACGSLSTILASMEYWVITQILESDGQIFLKVNHAHATLQYGMRHLYDLHNGMRSKKTTSSA